MIWNLKQHYFVYHKEGKKNTSLMWLQNTISYNRQSYFEDVKLWKNWILRLMEYDIIFNVLVLHLKLTETCPVYYKAVGFCLKCE